MDKLVYLAVSILDLSKPAIYEFGMIMSYPNMVKM